MKPTSNKVHIKIASSEEQENLKNNRKTLSILQQTATDKENLVGRTPKTSKSSENEMNQRTEVKKKKYANKLVQTGPDTKISVEDLTSEAGPSENYWEILAEKRREALDETLEENKMLHEKIIVLEEENKTCKEMLDEAKSLVAVLTEMLEENSPDEPEEATEVSTN